jgi:hypothetical protein
MVPANKEDLDHLRLLSIFHYVYAAITAAFSLMGVVFMVLGAAMLANPAQFADNGEPPPPFVGYMIGGLGTFFVLLFLGHAVLTLLAGRFIARRKHHLYCLILAGFNCMSFPFGTALGVFTFIVLLRPSVKAMFEQSALPAPPPVPA